MEKLLQKFLSEDNKLSLLLLELKPFAEDSNDEALIEFVNNESNGYSTTQNIPEYRKIQSQIIGTIQDSYGQIVFQGKSLDFSVLSEHIGFDLNVVPIPDGIGFLEDALKQLTSQFSARPIPQQLVKMLNDTFKHNNPNLKLVSASHDMPTASLQFILTKVRQDCIIGLQKLIRQNNSDQIQNVEDEKINAKTIFVTYAWDDNSHNDKVISFVDFLRKKGYDASMDRKFSQEETSINFNKMMVEGIQNSDKVIIILNPKYKEKADKFDGGVGIEIQIILEEIKSNPNKFIFASFGVNQFSEIVPTSLSGREILDLKKDQDETDFNILFAKIESKNILQFSDVSKETNEIKTVEIKPFKL